MRRDRAIVGALLAGCILAIACSQQTGGMRTPPDRAPIELTNTLEPLRDHFNGQSRLPRVVLLLSPT